MAKQGTYKLLVDVKNPRYDGRTVRDWTRRESVFTRGTEFVLRPSKDELLPDTWELLSMHYSRGIVIYLPRDCGVESCLAVAAKYNGKDSVHHLAAELLPALKYVNNNVITPYEQERAERLVAHEAIVLLEKLLNGDRNATIWAEVRDILERAKAYD